MTTRYLIFLSLFFTSFSAYSQNVYDQILPKNSDTIINIDILKIKPIAIIGRFNTTDETKVYLIEELEKVYIHEKPKFEYLLRTYSNESFLDDQNSADLYSSKPLGKLKENHMTPVHDFAKLLSEVNKIDVIASDTLAFDTGVHLSLSLTGTTINSIKTINRLNKTIIENTSLQLVEVGVSGYYDAAKVIADDEVYLVSLKHLDRVRFEANSLKEFWQLKALESGTYKDFLDNGLQLDKRFNIHQEVLEYRNFLHMHDLYFEDAFLESYLQSLVYDIYPVQLDDGRTALLTVKIIKDDSPNAFIYADGSMFITTKLLSMLRSEEELYAILAHEVSHFVLDHSIVNIKKQEKREKRAKFWSAFATGLAALADGYLASKSDNYVPGVLTLTTATISFGLSSQIVERLGVKYSQAQESESDKCAVDLLSFKGKDPAALSSALNRIKDYLVESGNHDALSGEGSHPSIESRIKEIRHSHDLEDPDFDVLISLVNSFNIQKELESMNYAECKDLVERNIKADVATQNDYLALAISTIYMDDTEDSNKKALEYLSIAKTIKLDPVIGINKYEAITQIRLDRLDEAKASLERYQIILKEEASILDKIIHQDLWLAKKKFLDRELSWALVMIDKLDKL